jgi:hypothetical protein
VGHWCHLSKDLRGILPEARRRPWVFFPWLISYLPRPMDALFSWSDPGPWALSMERLIRAVFRELRSGVRGEEKIT